MIWLILAGALVLRLALALTYDGYWGVDGGAYLLSVNNVLGDEPTGAGFPRPPLAPGWLLVPFVDLFGDDVGYKVWSAAASLCVVVPVLLMARRVGALSGVRLPSLAISPWIVPFAAAFLCLDLLHAEMMVTGALPMIAFGLLGTAWWAMGSMAERWSRRDAVILALTIGLIPFVNQTTAGLACVTLPVYAVALWWFAGKQRELGARLLPPMILGGSIALTALPWYLQVLPGNGMLDYPGPVIYFTRMYDIAWLQLALGWGLGLLMVRGGQEPWLRALGILCCLLGTLTVFLSFDETIINVFYRSRYLLALPFYIGVTWALFKYILPWFKPAVALPLILLAFAVMGAGYISQVYRQADLSAMVTPETAAVLEELREEEDQGAIITNSFTLALWVAALNKVESPHTWTATPPPTFVATDLRVRCVLGWRPGCDTAAAIRELGARYVLIEERFPYYNQRAPGVYGSLNVEEPWEGLPALPWLTETYHQGTTMVYRIDVNASPPATTRTRPGAPSRYSNPATTIMPRLGASTRRPETAQTALRRP